MLPPPPPPLPRKVNDPLETAPDEDAFMLPKNPYASIRHLHLSPQYDVFNDITDHTFSTRI